MSVTHHLTSFQFVGTGCSIALSEEDTITVKLDGRPFTKLIREEGCVRISNLVMGMHSVEIVHHKNLPIYWTIDGQEKRTEQSSIDFKAMISHL